jgi:plastocyanin
MLPVRLRLLLGLVVAGTACTGGANDNPAGPTPSTAPTTEGTVLIRQTAYHPARVMATVGKEVIWRWQDNGVRHSVTADDGSFDSDFRTEGEFPWVFNRAGEFPYHCKVHARMKGTVVVSP